MVVIIWANTKQKQKADSSLQFIHSFRQGLPSASVHAHVPCMNTSCVSISCSKQSHKFQRHTLHLQKAEMVVVERVLFIVGQQVKVSHDAQTEHPCICTQC